MTLWSTTQAPKVIEVEKIFNNALPSTPDRSTKKPNNFISCLVSFNIINNASTSSAASFASSISTVVKNGVNDNPFGAYGSRTTETTRTRT